MNPTLRRFGHPGTAIREYAHWVVLIRPRQVTLGCTIIAAKSHGRTLGDLSRDEAAELPAVIRDFEAAITRIALAARFNYLALMMIDPNPHFHAIPRYAGDVTLDGRVYADASYPNPPDLSGGRELDPQQLEQLRQRLAQSWDDG